MSESFADAARHLAPLAFCILALLIGLAVSARATNRGQLTGLVNAERSARGLVTLSADPRLTAHAQSHAEAMAAENRIFHSSTSSLRAAAGDNWTLLGENVGRGPDVDGLHAAFMGSTRHRANILGDYSHIGVGSIVHNGTVYAVVVFKKARATTTTSQPSTTATTSTPSTPISASPPARTLETPETVSEPFRRLSRFLALKENYPV